MTRSEEEVSVDQQTRQAGTARLRQWVETENVNITVPVRREKARLVTEPITVVPPVAAVGATITVSPAGQVQRMCLGPAVVYQVAGETLEPAGMLDTRSGWQTSASCTL